MGVHPMLLRAGLLLPLLFSPSPRSASAFQTVPAFGCGGVCSAGTAGTAAYATGGALTLGPRRLPVLLFRRCREDEEKEQEQARVRPRGGAGAAAAAAVARPVDPQDRGRCNPEGRRRGGRLLGLSAQRTGLACGSSSSSSCCSTSDRDDEDVDDEDFEDTYYEDDSEDEDIDDEDEDFEDTYYEDDSEDEDIDDEDIDDEEGDYEEDDADAAADDADGDDAAAVDQIPEQLIGVMYQLLALTEATIQARGAGGSCSSSPGGGRGGGRAGRPVPSAAERASDGGVGATTEKEKVQPCYAIRHPQSGRVLHVQRSGTMNGTPVSLYEKNLSGAQKWTLEPDGRIRNPASGKFLTARRDEDGDGGAGSLVIWESCAAGGGSTSDVALGSQAWKYTEDGMLVHKATGKALTGARNSDKVVLSPFNGCDDLAQQWSLIPLSSVE